MKRAPAASLLACLVLLLACGGDDSTGVLDPGGEASASGTGGAAGSPSGASGKAGASGASGASDAGGTGGAGGSKGANGSSGVSGENGSNGTAGIAGATGSAGAAASGGAAGTGGASGTTGGGGSGGTAGANASGASGTGSSSTGGVSGTGGAGGTDTNGTSVGGASGTSSGGYPELAVGTIVGATSDELVMIADGVVLANETMKTPCFKDFVLSASWTETNGLTQEQIWEKLCSGTVTVDVDMYDGSWYDDHVTHTIGYEDEPGTVHMNRYFVDSAYMVADNIIHEGEGHSQGFSHYGVKDTSVPYGLNHAFEACSPVSP